MRDRKAKKRVDGSQQGQGKSLMAGERRRGGLKDIDQLS